MARKQKTYSGSELAKSTLTRFEGDAEFAKVYEHSIRSMHGTFVTVWGDYEWETSETRDEAFALGLYSRTPSAVVAK